MEEETLFPRGGADRSEKKEVKEPAREEKKKNRKRSNSKDFLFGKEDRAKAKRSKKSKKDTSAPVATSALPIGGGAVLQPVQSANVKKAAFIEAISFQKLAKGTKLLGVVREVADEYAVVSLPSMLTGFIRKDSKSGIPLYRVLNVGQFLPVVVVKATSETVKSSDGQSGQMKRRIELSISPNLLNNGLSLSMLYEGMSIRGRIRSVEDHGCVIDLNISGLGSNSCFLKYENILGEYKVVNYEEDSPEESDDESDDEEDNLKFKLNKGRIYDFTISSLPENTTAESARIIQVKLEPTKTRAAKKVEASTHLAAKHTIRTLNPGMLVDVDVEHFARNGLCVSLIGNVYRGAIDSGHLGGYIPDEDFKHKNFVAEMWWKSVFVGKNRKVTARLIAVDPTTKIIRLSLLPNILSMEISDENALPEVGSIVENARVVRLDPGVGALLALPPSEDSMDVDDKEDINRLCSDEIYKSASRIKCAYVHISKAIDNENKRVPDNVFAKTFSLNNIIPKLRILSTSNWIENVASCTTAESIVSSPVLTHADLKPGAIYRAVKIIGNLNGGGVLVQLGGNGIKGLIPATHLFDKFSGDSAYRNKIRAEKYKVGKKIDVRCLVSNPHEKKCTLTAKKSLVTDSGEFISDYASVKRNTVATGFVSSVNKKGITVTFYNNVYGKISARRLAEEVGVEDPTVDYHIGDVVKARIQKVVKKTNDDDEEFYSIVLSMNLSTSEEGDVTMEAGQDELYKLLSPGAILPTKSMKIVELVPSKKIGKNEFLPGHAIVTIKAKYLPGGESQTGSISCKLPFEQILDAHDEEILESAESFDAEINQYLKVGKKIAQEALVLATSGPKGAAITPIVSLKSTFLETAKSTEPKKKSSQIILPAPKTPLYMGAYVQGYCARVDSRYGAFIRFLDNLTAIVPKLKGGLDIGLYDTVLCKIIAMDVTNAESPKILLKRVTSTRKEVQSQAPTNTLIEKLKPGDIVGDVRVDSVNFARVAVTLLDKKFEGCAVKARIHVTMAAPLNGSASTMPVLVNSDDDDYEMDEDKEKITAHHPFSSWNLGTIVQDARCVSIDIRDGTTYVELSNRDSEEQFEMLADLVHNASNIKPGTSVCGIITAVSKQNKGIWVQIAPGCTGFIPGLQVSKDVNVLNNMQKHFKIGGRINCSVVPNQAKNGPFKQIVRLSALEETNSSKPSRGDILIGRVNRNLTQVYAPSLMVQLPDGSLGRCDITELEEVDDWENMPLGRKDFQRKSKKEDEDSDDEDQNQRIQEGEFHHGLYLQCRVLSAARSGPCEISLRESRLDGDFDVDEAPAEKEIVHAFVVNTNKKGCFLRLARNIEGRVILKQLSDSFLPDPISMFPPGRLVVGKVKKVTKNAKKNKVNVDLDLRESILLEDQDKLTFDDIKEGEKHGGVVTRIESYGVFVRLENSEVSGLVHLSECSDDYVKNLSSLYSPGDLVKVLVIKVDAEEKRIGLSMKPSNFDDSDSEDESDSDDDSDEEMEESNIKFVDDDDSDDENYAAKLASKMNELENEDEGDSDSEDGSSSQDESSSEEESSEDEDDTPQAMDVDVGFDWDAKGAPEESADDSDSSDSSDSEDDSDNIKKGHKARKKAAAKKEEEKEIAKQEQRLADGTADENPETTADFERLLASDPNSSENWIKFMAYHLSLADIESARNIAKRAFEKIEFRQEGEKLNVWTALITLENKYGSNKSFMEAIEKAAQHNNPKQVYLRVCEMLEKDVVVAHGDASAMNRADDMFKKMCKKFKSKKTVWIAHFGYLLKNGRHDEAHKLWKRSVQSLPEYKHVETMSKFAQLEYEHGSAERARTIFDALLEKNRKRMDLLFVYVDKEIKHGDIEVARRLFERTINPADKKKLKFNDKQMKSLFKKWYRMEDEHGDDDSRLRVKSAAKEYVEKSTK